MPDVRIEKMLRILQEVMKGNSVEESADRVNEEFTINPSEDLNKLSDEQLVKKKKVNNYFDLGLDKF